MIFVLSAVALAYLPLCMAVAGSLHRIADALDAQNKHYDIGVEK